MKSPAEWSEPELLELIHLKQEEGLQLDFKRAESLDSADKKKMEISKDVSAFANSAGGAIIYGMAESTSQPHYAEKLSPVEPSKYSKEWLEQIINSRIQPRIQGLVINSVALNSSHPGKCAYIACVPQSTTAHQASDHRYYKRHNFESVPMEDYEVRQTMDRASRPAYSTKLFPTQMSDRDGRRFFQLGCTIQNISEILGRDVSAVLYLPKHVICQPDNYELSVEGITYSRVPGTWGVTSHESRTAIDIHPITPYNVFFQRELAVTSVPSLTPLRAMIRVYDQFGLALTSKVMLATPGLETVSVQDVPPLGMVRQSQISEF